MANPNKKPTEVLADVRSNLLGKTPKFKSEIVLADGTEIEVRQPTVGQRALITKKAECTNGKNVDFDYAAFLLWSVIFSSYLPGTDQLVFSPEDYKTLSNMPTGGYIDDLQEAAQRLNNVTEDKKKKN